MYATQKYSAQDRVSTAQEWARKYPSRVSVIISSPHWKFYCFKCLLVPTDMTVRELGTTVHHNWLHKFPKGTTHLLFQVAPQKTNSVPLPPTQTLADIVATSLAPDGFLYLTVHKLD